MTHPSKEKRKIILAPIAAASFFGDGAKPKSSKKIERKAGLKVIRSDTYNASKKTSIKITDCRATLAMTNNKTGLLRKARNR